MAEDYERANAREWDLHYRESNPTAGRNSNEQTQSPSDQWQVVESSKKAGKRRENASSEGHKQKASLPKKWTNARGHKVDIKPRRPPANLLIDVDNEAQQAWRNRKPPTDTMRIPDELALQDRHLEAIGRQYGTFLFSEHSGGMSGTMIFGIWGDASAVSATKRAINAWIGEWRQSSANRSHLAAQFSKIASLTPMRREQAEKSWLREVKRQRFRQHPPPGTVFESIGTFHWPMQDYRPEDILGMSYEALDPIRMDCECYVVFIKERSVFQVSGKTKEVQRGLDRLRRTCFQIAARSMNPIRLYLPHWLDTCSLPSHVHLKPYEHPTALSNDNLPHDVGNAPHGEGTYADTSLPGEQTVASEARVRTLFLQLLKNLHFYRGGIQMRMRLGTFLATQFRRPADGIYELEEYASMIKESQFIGQVTHELGDRRKESAALSILQGAEGLLHPEDHFMKHLSLFAVRPVFSATFTFADSAGDLCLIVAWNETQDAGAVVNSFDRMSKKWVRLERDTSAPATLLDISLTDLNTGMAWQFDVQASTPVHESRLSKALVDFGRSVEIDTQAALQQASTRTDKSFVIYKPYAVNLKSIQQRMSYRYHIRTKQGFPTDYILELTRFVDRKYTPSNVPLLAAAEMAVYEPRWSLSVYRTEWDSKFACNESLKVGEMADWADDIETWFPEDLQNPQGENTGAGFEHLMENLKRIGRMMVEVEEDDLIDGMTVG